MSKAERQSCSQSLDRAAKILGGCRKQLLESDPDWDVWYFPKDKAYIINLFVPDPAYIFKSRIGDTWLESIGNFIPKQKTIDI